MLLRISKLTYVLAAPCILTGLIWAAPAPQEKANPDEEAAEPAKGTDEEIARHVRDSQNNLKNIALAFHNYAAANNELPHNIADPDGKVLLSWRVRVLPYLEQDNLYRAFKLDEPWDSEHNKKLIEKMPDVYSSPRVVLKKKGFTVYQGFAGAGALFEKGVKLNFPSITDGTSNTILAVESSTAVPWTKPVDLPFDVKKDVPNFGKAFGDKPIAAVCDGSVRTLDLKTLKPAVLKADITIAGGEIMEPNWANEP
jgi:hypothetical protein